MDLRKIKRYKYTISYGLFMLIVVVPLFALTIAALWKYVTS